MSSAVITVTERNIAARQAAAQRQILAIRHLRKGDPSRARREADVLRLNKEIATLRASLHYYKPVEKLALDIERQQNRVQTLVAATKKTSGKQKAAVIRELRGHNQHLKEMIAAAHMKRISPDIQAKLPESVAAPSLVSLSQNASRKIIDFPRNSMESSADVSVSTAPMSYTTPEGLNVAAQEEEDALAHELSPEEASRRVAEHAMDFDYLYTQEPYLSGTEGLEDTEEPWYKHPAALVSFGVIAGVILVRFSQTR